ncbi:serine hydrolase [Paraflavitalea sp. CAU 1676]|uniref:serine hydrolase n=1 Tax=Paraflavitalea sp. CAU 1676 TaxID=3032598 RepID=UPI0023D9C9EF|nr:serine hydrolase [Paraflavitalea sp. CAU 1676]MDF2190452.1 serine hydrolase [Paraflavitalea sp. CAU 1676]
MKIFLLAGLLGLACHAHAQDSTVYRLDRLMQAWRDQGKFSGTILVAQKGKVLLHQGYGFKDQQQRSLNDTNTLYQIASVTKPFTSTLIGQLVIAGKLSLTDKLQQFYPGFPHGDSITIGHLLTHTAGLWDYTRDVELMEEQTARSFSQEEIIRVFKDQPLDFAPGTGWSYCNAGYFLLGGIIEKKTGLSYEQAMRKYVFTPLGMRHSAFDFRNLVSVDKAIGYYADSSEAPSKKAPVVDSTVPWSAGSIYSTAGDLYQWYRGLKSRVIIPQHWLDSAWLPRKNKYGYGWMTDSVFGRRVVSHSGGIFGFRSAFWMLPKEDVCIVVLSNMETMSREEIARRLLAVVLRQPYSLPVMLKAVPVDTSVLRKYEGTYRITANGVVVVLALEHGRLIARPERGPASELLALDNTHFFLSNEHEFRIRFELDAQGKVVQMMLNPKGTEKPALKIK